METPAAPITFVPDVRAGTTIGPSGLGHSTVLTSPDVRVVVLTFDAGHVMKEHRAPKTLLLQALDGHLRITAGGEVTDWRGGKPSGNGQIIAVGDARVREQALVAFKRAAL